MIDFRPGSKVCGLFAVSIGDAKLKTSGGTDIYERVFTQQNTNSEFKKTKGFYISNLVKDQHKFLTKPTDLDGCQQACLKEA